jgi:hypothetical protein
MWENLRRVELKYTTAGQELQESHVSFELEPVPPRSLPFTVVSTFASVPAVEAVMLSKSHQLTDELEWPFVDGRFREQPYSTSE